MKEVFKAEWKKIVVAEINKEIEKLPKIMELCYEQIGSNKYHT